MFNTMYKPTIENMSHLDRTQNDFETLPTSIDIDPIKEKRRSSDCTNSTSNTCGSDEIGNVIVTATACASSESRRSRRRSSTSSPGKKQHKNEKKTGKGVRKKILVDLISKEMMNTLSMKDEEDLVAEGLTTNMPSSPCSSSDLFYAMMNGEMIDLHNNIKMMNGETKSLQNRANCDVMDHPALELDDIEVDCDLDNDLDPTSFHKLAFNISCDVEDSRVPLRQIEPLTHTLQDSVSNASNSSATNGREGLSMSEIQKIVLQSIPPDVRNKIPEEAWSKIFGESRPDATSMPRLAKQKIDNEDDDDNESSVVSDVTNATQNIAKEGFAVESQKRGSWTTAIGSQESDSLDRISKSQPPSHRLDDKILTQEKGKFKKVSFAKVQVRYYERILDINPSVTTGPAIGIGWRYKRGGVLEIDEWEMRKGDSIRCAKDLLLPSHVRKCMLKEVGFTQRDIAAAVRVILKAKNQRKQTVQNLGAEAMEEALESATRNVKYILHWG